jgi:hypothetical protein
VCKRFLQIGQRAAGSRHKDDLHVIGLRKLAHPRNDLERPVAIRVHEHDSRMLHRNAGHQHRQRHVHHDVAAVAQCLGDALSFRRRIADEDDGCLGAADAFVVDSRSGRQGSSSRGDSTGPLRRRPFAPARRHVRKHSGTPNERKNEQDDRELPMAQREHPDTFTTWRLA